MLYIDSKLPYDNKKELVLSLKNRTDLFTTNCEKCGCEYIKKKYSFVLRPLFLCKDCQRKQTSLNNWGYESPMQSPIVKEKQSNVIFEKYGVKNSFQTENSTEKRLESKHSEEHKQKMRDIQSARTKEEWKEIKEKTQNTCQEKYGEKYYTQTSEFKQKYKEIMQEKHGVDNYFQTDVCREISRKWASSQEFREKTIQTMLERYGEIHCMYIDEFKQKQQETNRKKYGGNSPAASKSVIEKIKQTCIERYGENYIHVIRKSSHRKIDGQYFDSSWEYAFWKYHKDKNIDIQREPIAIEYYDEDNIRRIYIPDFKVNDIFYEIKGEQFFTENGNLINPYNKKILLEKQKCMESMGVIILRKKDLQVYFDYMCEIYGKNWKKILYKNNKKID